MPLISCVYLMAFLWGGPQSQTVFIQEQGPTSSIEGWQTYLAYNRARGVLALERRDGYLYVAHSLETYNAVLFPVGRWDNFWVLFTSPWVTIHGVRGHQRIMHFAWKGAQVVEEQSIPLRDIPLHPGEKGSPFTGSLSSYLAYLSLKPAKSVPDFGKPYGFVGFSEYGNLGIQDTLYYPDGKTLAEVDNLCELYDYKPPGKPSDSRWDTDLSEYIREYGLPFPLEATKFYKLLFGKSKSKVTPS